jgi:malto-oligosyltrehalose synthase/4-alpha-glucanotransferase
MLPFFGKSLEDLISDGEITLIFARRGFMLKYFENEYPVSYAAYRVLFSFLNDSEKPVHIDRLFENSSPNSLNEEYLPALYENYRRSSKTRAYISGLLEEVNNKPHHLKTLIANLDYIPVHWKETEKHINYRRFFTINGLICLNIQDDEVFNSYHQYISSLIKTQHINGLRIDHIDGLSNPSDYLRKLRSLVGVKAYIIVEKILEEDEKLPAEWPVEGSTGYDFLAMINNLLTNRRNIKDLFDFYRNWSKDPMGAEEYLRNKKRFILYNRLRGELELLSHLLLQIRAKQGLKIAARQLQKAIAEFMVYFPVYKMYNSPSTFSDEDKKQLKKVFKSAIRHNPKIKNALEILQEVFFLSNIVDEESIKEVDRFFRRCMQFTGPLMAKGVEDTAFYSYNPFIAYNEVGDNPSYFGISVKKFHKLMKERQEASPLSMNTLATHDTKRGDDARARMNVITDLPKKWREATSYWHDINLPLKTQKGKTQIPDTNDEYFIYQTLCAHFPMNGNLEDDFSPRLEEYLIKAFREAKENSSWSDPDIEYEEATIQFLRAILSPDHLFLRNLQSFVKEIIPHGIINSLTQTIIKNTAPGIPDTFQGTETWNLSFVDPDNRRPVNYKNLEENLEIMIRDHSEKPLSFTKKLWQDTSNGYIKQWASYLSLQERAKNPDLFLKGEYIAVKARGKYKDHIIAYIRRLKDNYLLVAAALNTASMPSDHNWEETYLELPDISPSHWEDIFTALKTKAAAEFPAAALFENLPFAILKGQSPEKPRKAGILMHISSLPGKYGIGDFGEEAFKFIDFLHRTGQRYWQILPLSQTDKITSYSPYSSYSAFAGNTLFIDPAGLVEEGLLEPSEVERFITENKSRIDYRKAEEIKNFLLDKAFIRFKNTKNAGIEKKLQTFRENEKYWLFDFAHFLAIKRHYDYLSWNEWPEEYRDRNPHFMEKFKREHRDEIEKIIFKQFIFSEQWDKLKNYANDRGVEIFGDIPIYIDYDSADVWSHPHLFQLNDNKSMKAVAGVPPDYFNENGQLWGMPLFNWEEMKKNAYEWWLNRIGKNLQWFDLLRLDHFRGFSAYWEVPADATVALHGKWVKGPAYDFFNAVRKEFPDMPFVAEDLGQIDQPVYDLRDYYLLPGMRVVQFGFEQNMPFLQHTPINYDYNSIAYTGTHDNNTMKGWYRKEATEDTLKRIRNYTGIKIKEKNCHLEMIRVAYSSIAKTTIIPIQDWLGLDENSRMNFPSTTEGNWLWKLVSQPNKKLEKKIRKMVKTFGRV